MAAVVLPNSRPARFPVASSYSDRFSFSRHSRRRFGRRVGRAVRARIPVPEHQQFIGFGKNRYDDYSFLFYSRVAIANPIDNVMRLYVVFCP